MNITFVVTYAECESVIKEGANGTTVNIQNEDLRNNLMEMLTHLFDKKVNTEYFTMETENYIAIWYPTSEDYSNKLIKLNSSKSVMRKCFYKSSLLFCKLITYQINTLTCESN